MTIPSEFPSTFVLNPTTKLSRAVAERYSTFNVAVGTEAPYVYYIIVPARNELEARTGSGIAGMGTTLRDALCNALEA